MSNKNPLLRTDGYKPSHIFQFPKNTTNTHYYGESRGGRYGRIPFFGLQGFSREYLCGTYCSKRDIEEASDTFNKYGVGFDKNAWMLLLDRHEGHLPIRIKAVKEGTVVSPHNVLFTVETTDPDFFWLPSYIETALLRGIWFPSTVCARSYACKEVIYEYLNETANAPMAELPFKLHDFGGRGTSSAESAAVGGAAHLVNFKGSDTLEGMEWMEFHYGSGSDGIAAFSINAMEHSTVLAWTRDGEIDAYRNMLRKFASPNKIIACVSDAYDYFNTVENIWCGELKEEVARSGATIVIRPDSGVPSEVCLKTMRIIERKIGCEKNLRGYKVLPSFFRVIQGDGNDNEDSISEILLTLKQNGYSASNIAFGMGGGLLQKLDRDTNKWAYKMSEITVDGEVRPVSKSPATDMGKVSKAGRFSLIEKNGELVTVSGENHPNDHLETVFENGKLIRFQNIDDIRALAGKRFV
jgi:nicotinamide phosphoribosyltransferase